jgi:NADPH-dependent curcumin reductase CurA
VVSAASGAMGQLGRLSCGGIAGFDASINYKKATDLTGAAKELAPKA